MNMYFRLVKNEGYQMLKTYYKKILLFEKHLKND